MLINKNERFILSFFITEDKYTEENYGMILIFHNFFVLQKVHVLCINNKKMEDFDNIFINKKI